MKNQTWITCCNTMATEETLETLLGLLPKFPGVRWKVAPSSIPAGECPEVVAVGEITWDQSREAQAVARVFWAAFGRGAFDQITHRYAKIRAEEAEA